MKPRERVIAVIKHKKPDRIPISAWIGEKFEDEINQVFSSVENFEDHYEFDFAYLSGGPPVFKKQEENELLQFLTQQDKVPAPIDILDLPIHDPDDTDAYQELIRQIQHHKEGRDRFTYVHVSGFFNFFCNYFSPHGQVTNMIETPDEITELYNRLLKWNITFSMNCLDLGIDMIHVSENWTLNKNIMFGSDIWEQFIYPYHKKFTETIKKRNAFISLHSTGSITDILEAIVDLRYDVVHPLSTSENISLEEQKRKYSNKYIFMGGLEIPSTNNSKDYFELQTEVNHILTTFKDGGLLFCTNHHIDPPFTIGEVKAIYDYVYQRIRELSTE